MDKMQIKEKIIETLQALPEENKRELLDQANKLNISIEHELVDLYVLMIETVKEFADLITELGAAMIEMLAGHIRLCESNRKFLGIAAADQRTDYKKFIEKHYPEGEGS